MLGGNFEDIKRLIVPLGAFLLLGGAMGVPYLITTGVFGFTLGGIEAGARISHEKGIYALTIPDATWAHTDEDIALGFDTEIHGRDDLARAFVVWSCRSGTSLDEIVRSRRNTMSSEFVSLDVKERRYLDKDLFAPVSDAEYSGEVRLVDSFEVLGDNSPCESA